MRILSVDIGSTWTKGALFGTHRDGLRLLGRAQAPTTAHLPEAYYRVERELLKPAVRQPSEAPAKGRRTTPGMNPGSEAGDPDDLRVTWSSSAHGGLAVAALGLVPDWTLAAARAAALSAGARITGVYSYQLTPRDLEHLNAEKPDILLFSGGTDGGNQHYVSHNARMLRGLTPETVIVYAGNRDAAAEVADLLGDRPMVLAENVLPDLREPAPESAREAIRGVFLDRIVEGKGLSELVAHTGSAPHPTPLAMLEYVRALGETGRLGRFLCLDMGGATTDVYSHGEATSAEQAIASAGLPEPVTRRTVEGDLGMRVSAQAAAAAARPWVERLLAGRDLPIAGFDAWIQAVQADPARLPATPGELAFDDVLASACVGAAASRHAGRIEIVYTAHGPTELRRGKDLRGFSSVVCTGGFLSRGGDVRPAFSIMPFDERGRIVCTPADARVLFDRDYLFPLLANARFAAPEAAVNAGIGALQAQ
ncbi:MAG: glutamate mutase [Deltaproteobacteria bacterium HGW-Deltaproteobacteria-22]|nr:MAG: glutamate mutase [Deltaproteobacteria bacterium HGW-Deltaproteobacteria-22]